MNEAWDWDEMGALICQEFSHVHFQLRDRKHQWVMEWIFAIFKMETKTKVGRWDWGCGWGWGSWGGEWGLVIGVVGVEVVVVGGGVDEIDIGGGLWIHDIVLIEGTVNLMREWVRIGIGNTNNYNGIVGGIGCDFIHRRGIGMTINRETLLLLLLLLLLLFILLGLLLILVLLLFIPATPNWRMITVICCKV